MSEIEQLPISAVLGDRNAPVKIDESWSKDVPASIGANAPITEFDRTRAIMHAVQRPSARRMPEPVNLKIVQSGSDQSYVEASQMHHFFAVDGKELVFIGSKEIDVTKFQKDLSGRFFREWLKQNFPGRRDYDDICVWNDATPLKEITDLLGMVE